MCVGLSHFLNYCWGVLDQAQNGFDETITEIYLVNTLLLAACVESRRGNFD